VVAGTNYFSQAERFAVSGDDEFTPYCLRSSRPTLGIFLRAVPAREGSTAPLIAPVKKG
jgi:hypothetical protein